MNSLNNNYLQIHPSDNVLVALQDLPKGMVIAHGQENITLLDDVKAKHKFSITNLLPNDQIIMYGVLVGKANEKIAKGALLTTTNIKHATNDFSLGKRNINWTSPDIHKWKERTFNGYHRSDGSVGTANYWLVISLVFCENRNMNILKQALVDKLGYGKTTSYQLKSDRLIEYYKAGKTVDDILSINFDEIKTDEHKPNPLFPNVDGIKFLTHDLGCGGTRNDARNLCGLLAGYITNANVAGATVLSLGCQNAQVSLLKEEISKRDANFSKPLYVFEQQVEGTEENLINKALKSTFCGLIEINKLTRKPASLSKLCIGLECGGSDGFSGISANPAIGYTSDLITALGGSVILAEFPELCGVEQELADRCVDDENANRFISLMRSYNDKAEALGSGFFANPSPGNIKDGLITDAIKSAGAAKKGGTSPVTQVLDYPEKVEKSGLALLCTPGSDVESTTAVVGAGANIVLFTTGLGTPTGNPIAPVIKLSTNTALFNKMPDIIDINCGSIIEGEETIQQAGERILEYVIKVASGEEIPKSVRLAQDDFIPWKRDISL
ncbi:UxaA family hydrolase [Pedobacter puniceum]|uniref:Altronate dehydratase n=1 Tax=Pedobacter puniceum TaxID=2666136 RepID=A0A7K0FNU5_9SPHI|nr:altronate dehydratase family protein [Pedobacter puniceum]MRX46920.1 altronate dehydratase [Pedobacter puniceum]